MGCGGLRSGAPPRTASCGREGAAAVPARSLGRHGSRPPPRPRGLPGALAACRLKWLRPTALLG
eukprot:1080634-Alexandrium_andersonii.AAC.1